MHNDANRAVVERLTGWTHEDRTLLIFKSLLIGPTMLFAAIVILDCPPLYFLSVCGLTMYVKVPNFRAALYSALLLGVFCVYSPFGWGFTHHPAPGANYLLSLAFFGAVWIVGIRTIQAWWQVTNGLRPAVLVLGGGLLTFVFGFGFESLSLQGTSGHFQRIPHVTAILRSLGILAGFGLLETVRTFAGTRAS